MIGLSGNFPAFSVQSPSFEPDAVCSIALCLSYHPNTEDALFVSLSSGWATTTGRLLGPKLGKNSIKCLSQGYSDALPHREVEPKFRNLSITNPALYKLSHAADSVQYPASIIKIRIWHTIKLYLMGQQSLNTNTVRYKRYVFVRLSLLVLLWTTDLYALGTIVASW